LNIIANHKAWPLVSVLIPAYNHERFVAQSLDSVIEESYPNKEIVIINDGSPDGTHHVISDWINKKGRQISVRYVSRENKGLTRTLNELIGLAKGEYVVILPSDDYLMNDGIISRYNCLKRNSGKYAVFGDCIVIDDNGGKLFESGLASYYRGRKKNLADGRLLPYEIIFNWCIPGPVFMARREVYRLVGTYDESLIVEDWDFYLRLAAKDLLVFLDRTVAAYRIHETNSISSISAPDFIKNKIVAISKNIDNFKGVKKMRLYSLKLLQNSLLLESQGFPVFSLYYKIMGKITAKISRLLYIAYSVCIRRVK
jgi:alpha-1,3-rhamnosyltransferase